MAIDSLTSSLPLAADEATFVQEELLYVAGGLLVVMALAFSFLGMRKKDFPSSSQLKLLLPATALVVIVTGFAAVQTARFEQAHKREENKEAAKESAEQEAENEESFDDATEGEAADPASPSGATPDDDEEPTQTDPKVGPGAADVDMAEGRTIFTDTGCGGCHVLADAGASGQTGPDLDEAIAGWDAEQIRVAIVDPGDEVAEGYGDGIMPATYEQQLDEVQLDTLVNYLLQATKK